MILFQIVDTGDILYRFSQGRPKKSETMTRWDTVKPDIGIVPLRTTVERKKRMEVGYYKPMCGSTKKDYYSV